MAIWALAFCYSTPILAQPITPADDGTSTIVTPNGEQFDIRGGRHSSDGRNLFHSFDRFGLEEGQTANFLADPNLSNILGRVTGRDPSFINGLLQVSGGSANLFLINPAGIVFGPSAALNVPADFTATTATGIGFGNGDRFNVFEHNNWANLVGAPNRFEFAIAHPGAIVNTGNLAVSPGGNLSLLGGTILNTGTLQASGGNVTVAAVPGASLVRLSAGDNLLSLEVAAASTGTPFNLTPLALPQLLAGGQEWGHASSVTVNPDGSFSLVGSQTPIVPQTGDAIVSGTVDVADGDISDVSGSLPLVSSSTVRILGDRIGLFDATLDASGTDGGGNIFIGGNFRGQGPLPNARVTFVDADTSIFADALQSRDGGGDGGRVILWADDTTQFFGNISARGSAAPIPHTPHPTPSSGGFVEVSGKQNLMFRGEVDTRAPNGILGTLLLDPENIIIANGSGDGAADGTNLFAGDLGGTAGQILAGDSAPVTVYELELESLDGNTNIILEATNNITIEDLNDNRLTLQPGTGSVTFRADADGVGGGSFSMNPDNRILSPGRDVNISGASLVLGGINTSLSGEDGGNITLRSSGGDLIAGDLWAHSDSGRTGGDISIEVANGFGSIDTRLGQLRSSSVSGRAGNITLRTHDGNILTHHIRTDSDGTGSGGNILLEISGTGSINIVTGDLGSDSQAGDGGDIALITQSGNITTADLFSFSGGGGTAGDITFTVRQGGGSINIEGLQAFSELGTGGNITLTTASGNILVSNNLLSFSRGVGNAGDVTLRINEPGGRVETIGAIAFSRMGDGGNLSIFSAGGDINVGGDLLADSQSGGKVGDITIEIDGGTGSLNATGRSFFANATAENLGNGGTISIRVPGNVITNEISAVGGENGGHISIVTGGSITVGQILTGADSGDGGPIDLEALGNITTASLESSAGTNGGPISLISQMGSLNTNGNLINSIGGENGGDILLESAQDITIGGIGDTALLNPVLLSGFNRDSGNISLRTHGGSIDISGPLLTPSAFGQGGNVELYAASHVTLNQVDARSLDGMGGTIAVNSGGSIYLNEDLETNQNNIILNAPVILEGDVSLSTRTSGDILFNNTIDGEQNLGLNASGGNLQVLGSIGGKIPLASIDILSSLNNGSIPIEIITMGDLNAEDLTSQSRISLTSQNGNITANTLDTSSILASGDITLSAQNIQLELINSQSQNATGGNVNIDLENHLQISDSFVDRNGIDASISTAGATGGGSIVIRHGGNGEIPFTVGDAARNGTDGAITRGNGSVETISTGEFFYTHTQDSERIQVISVPAPIETNSEIDSIDDESPSEMSPNPDETPSEGKDSSEPDDLVNDLGNESNRNSDDAVDAMEDGADSMSDTDNNPTSMEDGNGANNPGNGGDGVDDAHSVDGDPINDLETFNPGNGGDGVDDSHSVDGDPINDLETFNPSNGDNGFDGENHVDGDPTNDLQTPNPGNGGNGVDDDSIEGDPTNNLETPNLDRTSDTTEGDGSSDIDLREQLAREIAASLDADLSLEEDEVTWTLPDPKQDISLKLALGNPEGGVAAIDRFFEEQIEEEAGERLKEDEVEISAQAMRETLKTIELETGKRAVIVYALTLPQTQALATQSNSTGDRHGEQLTLVLVVPEGPPIVKTVNLESRQLKRTLGLFRQWINDYNSQSYLPSSQQLYRWLIQPLDEHLEALDIDTLIFAMDAGLQQLPLAALHDGEQFLIERYSLGSIPSLSLTDTRYRRLDKMQVLAMGASEFPQSGNSSLPAVPLELALVAGSPSPLPDSTQALQESQRPFLERSGAGQAFLNEEFTLDNLIEQRQQQPFDIIHLATHANFDTQNHDRAYIELWDARLSLDAMRLVEWYAPPIVELLVLSACETAVGNREAELGFAGLAVRAGVKSVLASLWLVGDTGTLAMMSQFYDRLQESPIKAEALRQAQLALARGEVMVRDGHLIGNGMRIPLPPETGDWDDRDFSHPYFWSGFTMVGSPW